MTIVAERTNRCRLSRGVLSGTLSVGLLAACSSPPPTVQPTAFELMLNGFPECVFKNVYIDLQTRRAAHAYFRDRQLVPKEIVADMAVFQLDETFHGLKVDRIAIPASTFDVHTIYIDAPADRVSAVLAPFLTNGFYTLNDEDLGEKPVLMQDRTDENRSILTCGPRE